MPGQSRYSLWLVPAADAYVRLRRLIDDVAERYGCPPFEPHVTLAGDLSGSRAAIAAVAARVAAQTNPFHMTLADLVSSSAYFYCVFHPVRAPAALEAAHVAVCRALQPDGAERYRPHLSVAYGLADDHDRQHVAATYNANAGLSLLIREIELVETSAALAPRQWPRLETFPMRPD